MGKNTIASQVKGETSFNQSTLGRLMLNQRRILHSMSVSVPRRWDRGEVGKRRGAMTPYKTFYVPSIFF